MFFGVSRKYEIAILVMGFDNMYKNYYLEV